MPPSPPLPPLAVTVADAAATPAPAVPEAAATEGDDGLSGVGSGIGAAWVLDTAAVSPSPLMDIAEKLPSIITIEGSGGIGCGA